MLYLPPTTLAYKKARNNTAKFITKSTVILYKNNDFFGLPEENTYIGITISKRSVSKAVKRNKIKRRYKAIIREYLQNYKLPNLTVILIARAQISNFSFEDLQKEILNNLNKIKQQHYKVIIDGRS
ncbi:MAG: ribonuclease P protein component [Rickettsiales bacterium]|jgi:ribonuclease P protein component|nr:ribonuclease P protein component [Rickettsiales bacterium]